MTCTIHAEITVQSSRGALPEIGALPASYDAGESAAITRKQNSMAAGAHKLQTSIHAGELPPVELIFGSSPAMASIQQKVRKIAASSIPVLIQGLNGTGKGVMASYLHAQSLVATGPFIKVNCAAIPGTLLESELFGYEKGAFTGAYSSKPGRAEMADHGTLFLDGIDEIDLGLQAKLLQVLQDGQFTRIGGREDIVVQIRVICAANRPLELQVSSGRFRQDLYYRINVVNLQMPPLSARACDVRALTAYFLQKHHQRHGTSIRPVLPGLMRLLEGHHWPGNIRELENLIERYVILGSEEAVSSELLNSGRTRSITELPMTGPVHLKTVTRQAVHELEKKIITNVLEANHWNRKRTASELRISYRALLYKIRQAGLPPKRTVRRTVNAPPANPILGTD
jgi:two-component system response regulator AtoC